VPVTRSPRSIVVWLLRALWAVLPVLCGPAFERALRGASRPVQVVAALGLWAAWAVVLVLTLVPTTVSLTGIRLVAPAAPLLVLWAVGHGLPAATAAVALSGSALAVIIAFAAEVGQVFVQGSAYGEERRFPLRPPGPLVLGPIEVAWSVVATAVVAGPLLLAARQWIGGAIVTLLALATAPAFARRCHRLTRRFAVVLPVGIVLHDYLVLADTTLFRRG
jgi:hypothetical protein